MTTQLTPLAYPLTIGIVSAQILATNASRKGLMFINPSNNTVSVCPAFTFTGASLAAVLNGAGSLTILPAGVLILPGAGLPGVALGCAWNAIASGAGTPFTVWEF